MVGCTMAINPNFQPQSSSSMSSSHAIEPDAGQWGTWVLSSGDELRPAAPPDLAASTAEIAQLKTLAAQRDAATQAQVTYWDAGAPSYRWIDLALAKYSAGHPNPSVSRGLALVNVALYDAMVATWDAKYAYNRPHPSQVDASLTTLIANPDSPSYPSAHAVAAGAASTVLGYLFPDDAATFTAKAEEAGQSRLLAGVSYPSDVDAGLALGRAVGEKVVAWALADGSDAVWTGTVPTGPGRWQGTNPVQPLAGTWKTWVLSSGDQLRAPAPPAYDSDLIKAQLDEIKRVTRTVPIVEKAMYWNTFAAGYNYWYDWASMRLFERGLDRNPPYAARVYATLAVAYHDGIVACFDTKYAYWFIRPPQLDPEVTTIFPTPPHPSYPAADACATGASGDVLASFFPADADAIQSAAKESALSRIWAGIHFRNDVETGFKMGQEIAKVAIERSQQMAQSSR